MASTAIHRSVTSATTIKKFTLSMWVKRSIITDSSGRRMFTANGGTGDVYFRFNNDDKIEWSGHGSNASSAGYFITNRLFRDCNAWYHLVIKVDTTQGSSSDRLKFYVNGVEETSFSSQTLPDQDATDNIVNTSMVHRIGGISGQYFDGLLTHVHFTQGYAYDASTFGETDSTSGIWKPKTAPSVTYGTNGFFLKFENSGAMGTDSSGNSNTFSTTSGTLTQNVDSPTNNYAVLNALSYQNGTKVAAPTNGNTTLTSNGGSAWGTLLSTMGASSGKYYCEAKLITVGSYARLGICDMSVNEQNSNSGWFVGQTSGSAQYGINSANGNLYTNAGDSSYGNSFTAGDIIGIAMDLDNSKLYFSKNGTWQNSGVPTSGSTGTGAQSITADKTYGFAFSGYDATVWNINFGNGYFGTTAVASANADDNGHGAFEYDVPAGYYALNTKNIKEFG